MVSKYSCVRFVIAENPDTSSRILPLAPECELKTKEADSYYKEHKEHAFLFDIFKIQSDNGLVGSAWERASAPPTVAGLPHLVHTLMSSRRSLDLSVALMSPQRTTVPSREAQDLLT